MGSLTDYAENALIDHLLNSAYTAPATVYLALCTADPTDAATGVSMNEVANSGGYQRTAISFGAAATRRVTQNGTVTFPQATGSWGTVTHWAIVDSQTYGAGNVLAHGALVEAKQIVSGNTPSVATGEVYVEIQAGAITTPVVHKLLDLMFRNQAYAKPDTYVGLATATLSDTTTGSTVSEPGSGAYARVQVNPFGGANPNWTAASAGAASNEDAVTLPTATAPWGTIVAAFVASAAAAGDILFYDNNVVDQAVGTDDTVTFGAGDIDFSLS